MRKQKKHKRAQLFLQLNMFTYATQPLRKWGVGGRGAFAPLEFPRQSNFAKFFPLEG